MLRPDTRAAVMHALDRVATVQTARPVTARRVGPWVRTTLRWLGVNSLVSGNSSLIPSPFHSPPSCMLLPEHLFQVASMFFLAFYPARGLTDLNELYEADEQ